MSNTNDDTNMTGNADNCDSLRTKSGQGVSGSHASVEAQTGHGLTSMIELGLEPVPITKRPTPITDAEWQTECCSGASWYRIAERMKNRAADLERQLAEVTSQRDAAHQKCRDYRLVALGAEDALEKMTAQRDEAEKRAAIAESDAAKHKLANDVLHQDGERWRELSCLFARQRDALVEAGKQLMRVIENLKTPKSSEEWRALTLAAFEMLEALAAVKETEG